MGRRSRMRAAVGADLAVTVLGVTGLLGFLMAGRMDDANASPFDIFAFVWFFCVRRHQTELAVATEASGSETLGARSEPTP